ncbi:MAG: carbon starvation protein A [Thermoanaerobaculia bacterium]|nr:carbon starvation protein A [Thermoanaerobaculia bacterium]
MALPLLAVLFLALLAGAYRLYGGWIARRLGIDDRRATPAHTRADGVDYVATPRAYLFAQHFSAIAAAGPIAGPILAAQAFGWGPCLLWIALGVVLIGAVHDFTALAASVRHGARSIAEIAREQLGRPAGRAMMAFIWIALVYVVVAFADITAGTFVAGTEELRESGATFHPGGAVAMASLLYLGLSLLLGAVQRFLRPPLWVATLLFVPATFGVAWLGTHLSTALLADHRTWALLILGYCALASVTPVWALLQPRGYLGGYVLYTALALGTVGVLFGGYQVQQPVFKAWDAGGATGTLFPFLFVTIACGACSGFHGLICSGTTSKQVDRESHMHAVGYGAMLAEGFVALIALVTVMIVAPSEIAGLSPGTIYGQGVGRFMTLLIGEEHLRFAITFGAMAFSTFVFDTLDVCTRLGRYLVQELLGWQGRAGALGATLLTMALPAYFLLAGGQGAWSRFWTLFGASNQLLAALTLLTLTLWLRRAGKPFFFTLLPMLFVLAITLWALGRIALRSLAAAAGGVEVANGAAAAVLVGLALFLLAQGLRTARRPAKPA